MVVACHSVDETHILAEKLAAYISPGSVVAHDIPDYCIAVGNPARVIKKIEH